METPPRFGVVLGVTTIRMLRALGGFGGTKELRELHSARRSQLAGAPTSNDSGVLGCSKLGISAVQMMVLSWMEKLCSCWRSHCCLQRHQELSQGFGSWRWPQVCPQGSAEGSHLCP